MKTNRAKAVEDATKRNVVKVDLPEKNISEYFGENVFTIEKMQKFLSKDAFKSVKDAIENNNKINRAVADQVAAAMKNWAISKNAKAYTHWFQPLTGSTAEKHDSFFEPTGTGKGIEAFSGKELIQQEPDASSFPNGGIRQTFEARGYTAWDPSSPAFIMEIDSGITLCIPTIFISYTGESLDYKAPLLKSTHLLEKAALPIVRMYDRHANKIAVTLGWEQEYFLIDEALYYARPDLVLSGRTIVGHSPAKGQQLDDHYFGAIPERVYAFMLDFEKEAHLLGIPVRTRHNEVAPMQFELAPMFEEVNIAVDHNQLIMDILGRVAKRHRLRCLLHEKPYAGVNGSGKHNNWSLSTDTGKNLLAPGSTPKSNLLFLTFFVNVIKAVHEHADVLRAAIASAENDHRLGGHEAPPAIISVFIGSHLTQVLNEIEKSVEEGSIDEQTAADLKMNIHNIIPTVLLDNTDRNRTSPFAFTGNKFEIRAVGSTANCSAPMIVMNTIMANQLIAFKKEVDALKKQGETRDSAVLHVIREYIKSSKDILFEGNNYSQEWEDEAKRRGLTNIKNTAYALDLYETPKSKELFVSNNIFTELELSARTEIYFEKYILKIQIEARILGELALNHIAAAAMKYQNILIRNVQGLKEIGLKGENYKAQLKLIEFMAKHVNIIEESVKIMSDERKKARKIENSSAKAKAYFDNVYSLFETIRYSCDKLERVVDDNIWPLPKYREMLFIN